MVPQKEPFDRELLSELARGAQKTFDNAEALFFEAKILAAADAPERALFLHQISLEECAKIEMMGAWAVSLLAGFPVDPKKVLKAFTNHGRKNRTNAYMLDVSAEERDARERGDFRAAIDEFEKLQNKFHDESNDAKNASLYVDFIGAKAIAPSEKINQEMVAATAARNKRFLGLMYPKLLMLLKWSKAPEDAHKQILAFNKLMETVKDEKRGDALISFETRLNEFFETELAKHKIKNSKSDQQTCVKQHGMVAAIGVALLRLFIVFGKGIAFFFVGVGVRWTLKIFRHLPSEMKKASLIR